MPHDVANSERFRAVIDLCDQIDQVLDELDDPDVEDVAIQKVLNSISLVVGTVLHSIWKRQHHAVTIDARFGVEGYEDRPIETKVCPLSQPISFELGQNLEPTSDHPVWRCLDQVHDFVSDLYETNDDPDTRRMLSALLLTVGGIDVAIREDNVTNTIVCAESEDGMIKVTAAPMRME